jgi:hypothetical protein
MPTRNCKMSQPSAEGRFKIGDLVVGMPLQVMVSAQGKCRLQAMTADGEWKNEPEWEEYSHSMPSGICSSQSIPSGRTLR